MTDVVEFANSHNGAVRDGYKGNRVYHNLPRGSWQQRLPEGVIYKEYDIYPYIKGQPRGAERVVIGNDGSVWYTDNHYDSFIRIK